MLFRATLPASVIAFLAAVGRRPYVIGYSPRTST
jgi:hypothetical protein